MAFKSHGGMVREIAWEVRIIAVTQDPYAFLGVFEVFQQKKARQVSSDNIPDMFQNLKNIGAWACSQHKPFKKAGGQGYAWIEGTLH